MALSDGAAGIVAAAAVKPIFVEIGRFCQWGGFEDCSPDERRATRYPGILRLWPRLAGLSLSVQHDALQPLKAAAG
jgi:hypothetical protein